MKELESTIGSRRPRHPSTVGNYQLDYIRWARAWRSGILETGIDAVIENLFFMIWEIAYKSLVLENFYIYEKITNCKVASYFCKYILSVKKLSVYYLFLNKHL